MYIAGRHFNNKAVSQVIAALLLIAISVAAAVLVYVFSIGLLGSLQSGGGQQAKQQVIMEAYNWNNLSPPTKLDMTLRNVGPAQFQFSDVFINGALVTPASSGCMSATPAILGVGSSCVLEIGTPPASYNTGVSYVIKIVSIDGAVMSYSAICGSAS